MKVCQSESEGLVCFDISVCVAHLSPTSQQSAEKVKTIKNSIFLRLCVSTNKSKQFFFAFPEIARTRHVLAAHKKCTKSGNFHNEISVPVLQLMMVILSGHLRLASEATAV